MMRLLLPVVAAFALAACEDFDHDLQQYCAVKGCSATGGSGGSTGTGGGSGGGSGVGGGSGACREFGSACNAEGQCCTMTTDSKPMACSRVNYCQIAAADCRETKFTCSSGDQCCSGICDTGRCKACAMDGESCTTAHSCCNGEICGDDNLCHTSYVGNSSAPSNGKCKASGECVGGYCFLDGGNEGLCANASLSHCTPSESTPDAGSPCCPGLMVGAGGTCGQPDGTWCVYTEDCAGGDCQGGRCSSSTGAIPAGGRCDSSPMCAGLTNYCDPVGAICTDKWCFGAVQTPWKGCCTIGGNTCSFADAGECVLPGVTSGTVGLCCSGTYVSGTSTCDTVQIFNP